MVPAALLLLFQPADLFLGILPGVSAARLGSMQLFLWDFIPH